MTPTEYGAKMPENQDAKAIAVAKRFYTSEEVMAEQDVQWLIDGIMPEGFGSLYAMPKTKKTFVALDFALTVATPGAKWFGREVHNGPVVYVCGEGFTGIKKRLAAWKAAKGKEGVTPDIHIHKGPVNMLAKLAVSAFVDGIRKRGADPVLIVLDTLARCFGAGDENSPGDMGSFIANCDRLRDEFPGCTVLVLHHTAKAGDKKGGRGHSSLHGALDFGMTVTPGKNERLTLRCTDMKEGEPFSDIPLACEKAAGSLVVRLADGLSKLSLTAGGPQLTKTQAKLMRAIEGDGPGTLAELVDRTGIAKSTVHDGLTRLGELGRLEQGAGGLWRLSGLSGSGFEVGRTPDARMH